MSESDQQLEPHGPQGLLFSGDVIQSLKPRQVAEIGEFANRMFGVEVRPVWSIERELGNMSLTASVDERETEPDAIVATKADFRRYAAEHGYSNSRACRSWNYIGFTTPSGPHRRSADQLPPVRWLNKYPTRGEATLDLRSVHERLVASELRSDAWVRGNSHHVAFLAQLVNELVQPETPLPASRAEWVRNQQNHR